MTFRVETFLGMVVNKKDFETADLSPTNLLIRYSQHSIFDWDPALAALHEKDREYLKISQAKC